MVGVVESTAHAADKMFLVKSPVPRLQADRLPDPARRLREFHFQFQPVGSLADDRPNAVSRFTARQIHTFGNPEG